MTDRFLGSVADLCYQEELARSLPNAGVVDALLGWSTAHADPEPHNSYVRTPANFISFGIYSAAAIAIHSLDTSA